MALTPAWGREGRGSVLQPTESQTCKRENHLAPLLESQVPGPHSRLTELESATKCPNLCFLTSTLDASYEVTGALTLSFGALGILSGLGEVTFLL